MIHEIIDALAILNPPRLDMVVLTVGRAEFEEISKMYITEKYTTLIKRDGKFFFCDMGVREVDKDCYLAVELNADIK